MFKRLNSLHIHQYHYRCARTSTIIWPKKLLKTQMPALNSMLWQRHCCDIKRNEELLLGTHGGSGVIIPTPLKIKQMIRSGSYDFIDGYTCIQTSCPTCPSSSASSSSTDAVSTAAATTTANTASTSDSNVVDQTSGKCLFINKTTGDVICSKCQHIFSFSAIEKFFTKAQQRSTDLNRARDLFMRSKPKPTVFTSEMMHKDAVPVQDVPTNEMLEILQYLDVRKIEPTVFQGVQAFCHVKRKSLYFPMIDIQSNIVGYKKLSRPSKGDDDDDDFVARVIETTIPERNSYGAVIFSPISKRGYRDQKTAVIVLNVVDALALRMEKTNLTIICLPYGFKNLPQECLPLFEPYSKLILWFDYNSVGWDMAKIFAKKLEERRCHFIRPTDDSPTPYMAIQQMIPMKSILSVAQPIVHKAVTTFRSLRQDVLSDLQNMDKVQGIKWKRYPILNKYLKGHRRGELTVLTGPTGCGKTTFMSEYSLDLAMQGVNTLWGSFEIRNTLLARTLLQQMACKPLDEHLEEFDVWANQFEQLPMYFMTFYGQQPLKVVMEAIEHSQYVHDIHHVIIDNLQFMMGTGNDPRNFDKYWKQDEIIAAFRTFATRRNCHVTLVIHPRKERSDEDLTINSIFGSAKATQEADNVLIIQDKRLISIKGKKYLQIAKNRYTGDLGIMMLDFDRDSLSYAQKK